MKKIILTLVTVSVVAAAGLQSAKADEHGWAVAGKVLTGIAAASVVAHAFAPPPTYYAYSAPPVVYSAPSYVAPPCVSAPATVYVAPPRPVVVYPAPVYSSPVYAAPAVNLNFRFGGGYHHYYHHAHW